MQKSIPQRGQRLIEMTGNIYQRGLTNSICLSSLRNDSLDSPQTSLYQTAQQNFHVMELTKRISSIKKNQANLQSLLKNCVGNLKARLAQEDIINRKLEGDVHELTIRANGFKQSVWFLEKWFRENRERALSVDEHILQPYQAISNSKMTKSKVRRMNSLQSRDGFKSASRAEYY